MPRSSQFSLQASYPAVSPSAALCFVRQSVPEFLRQYAGRCSVDPLSGLCKEQGRQPPCKRSSPCDELYQPAQSVTTLLFAANPFVSTSYPLPTPGAPKICLPGGRFSKHWNGVLQSRGRDGITTALHLALPACQLSPLLSSVLHATHILLT